jgi:hypothetical protein
MPARSDLHAVAAARPVAFVKRTLASRPLSIANASDAVASAAEGGEPRTPW